MCCKETWSQPNTERAGGWLSLWVNSSITWGGSAGLSDPARPERGGGCRWGEGGHLCGSAQPRATNKMRFEESYRLEVASDLMPVPGE